MSTTESTMTTETNETRGFEIGTVLESFRLEQRIGSGSFGEVWRAKDCNLEIQVAIKFLHPDVAKKIGVRRFITEARAGSALAKEINVVGTRHFFVTVHGVPAIVMEFIDGGVTLQKLIYGGVLSPAEALRILKGVLCGLRAAHRIGILHRDIKPENILIKKDGTPVIADFGIARMETDPNKTRDGTVMGTMTHMPPEQWVGGKISEATDVYALGIITGEMGGAPPPTEPFLGISEERDREKWLEKIRNEILKEIARKATNKKVGDRYASAEDMLAAVEAAEKLVPQDQIPWVPHPEPDDPAAAVGNPLTMVPDFPESLSGEEEEDLPEEPPPAPAPRTTPVVTAPPPAKKMPFAFIAILLAVGMMFLGGVMVVTAFWPSGKPEVLEVVVTEPVETPAPVAEAAAPEQPPPVEVKQEKVKAEELPKVVASVEKTKVAPAAKKSEKPLKADPKPVAVKAPVTEKVVATPVVTEAPKPETVSEMTVKITSYTREVGVGDEIKIAATILIPEGATEQSRTLFCRGEIAEKEGGAWQKKPLQNEGMASRGNVVAIATFGSWVRCYVDVRLVGGDKAKSSVVTTTIE